MKSFFFSILMIGVSLLNAQTRDIFGNLVFKKGDSSLKRSVGYDEACMEEPAKTYCQKSLPNYPDCVERYINGSAFSKMNVYYEYEAIKTNLYNLEEYKSSCPLKLKSKSCELAFLSGLKCATDMIQAKMKEAANVTIYEKPQERIETKPNPEKAPEPNPKRSGKIKLSLERLSCLKETLDPFCKERAKLQKYAIGDTPHLACEQGYISAVRKLCYTGYIEEGFALKKLGAQTAIEEEFEKTFISTFLPDLSISTDSKSEKNAWLKEYEISYLAGLRCQVGWNINDYNKNGSRKKRDFDISICEEELN